jgi:four helix bundle protein
MDHARGPAWRRGMELAHTVCAAVAGGALARTDEGQRLRKAAVSVPSLVGEAFLDQGAADASRSLGAAAEKLAEVGGILSLDAVRDALGESEQAALLREIDLLRAELDVLRGGFPGTPSH